MLSAAAPAAAVIVSVDVECMFKEILVESRLSNSKEQHLATRVS